MSLFDNFTKPMSEMFRISSVGYQVKSKMKPTPLTCHEMMEWLFRDPTTFPLARGKRVHRNLSVTLLSMMDASSVLLMVNVSG